MPPSLNTSNPAVKRILSEVKKMQTDPSDQFEAHPVEDDLFDWHFVLRGPADTPFEGGIYHGRIILPPQYPYKPPEFMFLCAQGRFEVGKKICLTISQHHPEMWQPSWDIRTALTAIQSFMPSPGNGAIAALDYNETERRALAGKSMEATRATLTAHGMLDAFADFLDAPPPVAGGGGAAAGGARREATAAAAVEISSSPAPPPPASQQEQGTPLPEDAAPVFSPKPREEPETKSGAGPAVASSSPAPSAATAPPPPRPADPQPSSAAAPGPPLSSTPSGTSTETRPPAAAQAAGPPPGSPLGGGEEPQRPAYAPTTYAPARAPQAQAARNRAGEGGNRAGGAGGGVQRERSGRGLGGPAPPTDDEVMLGTMTTWLLFGIVLLMGRRAAMTLFPDVQWAEMAQSLLNELILLFQDLFGDTPPAAQGRGEL